MTKFSQTRPIQSTKLIRAQIEQQLRQQQSILLQKFHQNIRLESSWVIQYKYFNALIIFISALCNSMVGVSLATVNHEITLYYNISTSVVSLCALITFFIFPLVALPANYILDNKGLKMGVSINCVFVIVGVSVRMLINQSFYFVVIGNAINAIGSIFLINCPPRFSAIWFKPTERIVITSLIGFANAVSGEIGAIMAPYFIDDNLTPQEGRNSVQHFIFFQAILVSSVMLINLIFFRGVPNKSQKTFSQGLMQSLSVSNQSSTLQSPLINETQVLLKQVHHKASRHQRHTRYYNQLKTLFLTPNYLFVLISFVFVCSVLSCFALNIELYLIPFGFTSNQAGNLTLLSVATGLIGSIISSLIIKKLKKFKIVILVQLFLSLIFALTFLLSLSYQLKYLMYLSVCLFTLILYPLFPAMIEYSCQFMHPIRQSTVAGILVGIGQLFSFAVGMFQTFLLEAKTRENVVICLLINAACYLIAFVAMLLSKQKLKRLLKQQNQALQ